MSIFHAYLDETGTGDESPFVRVVGLLAHHEHWATLYHDWNSILNANPGVQSWHTTAALNGTLPLSGKCGFLSVDDAVIKQFLLARLIANSKRRLIGVSVNLLKDDHAAIILPKLKPKGTLRRLVSDQHDLLRAPVYIAMREAARACVREARELNEVKYSGQPFHVWTIFEEDESKWMHQWQVMQFMHLVRREAEEPLRKAIGPCIFIPGKGPIGHVTLQAADLYAFHVRQRFDTGLETPVSLELGKIGFQPINIDRARLERILFEINKGIAPKIDD